LTGSPVWSYFSALNSRTQAAAAPEQTKFSTAAIHLLKRCMFYGRPWPCNVRGGGRGIAPVKVSVSDICPHGVAKQPFCMVIKQGEIKIVIVVIIIIIIILRTIFIVLSS